MYLISRNYTEKFKNLNSTKISSENIKFLLLGSIKSFTSPEITDVMEMREFEYAMMKLNMS